jgi:hypothetical protein
MHVHEAAHGSRTPLLAVLAGFTLLHVAALGLFARGFLLTRVELTTRSSCGDAALHDIVSRVSREAGCNCSSSSEAAHAETGSNGGHRCQAGCRHDGQSAGCWGARHFNKTAWVIVDALRFDFVACEGAQAAGAACRSRMPRLLDLAQSSVSPVSRSLQSIVRTSATAKLQSKASNSVRRAQRRRCTNLWRIRQRPPCSGFAAS